MERSGHADSSLNDQGLIFFLPNLTWGQPPYYTHQMASEAMRAAPTAVSVSMAITGASFSNTTDLRGIVSAQIADDNTKTTVRFVNVLPETIFVDLTITGLQTGPSTKVGAVFSATMTVLHSARLSDANTPAAPLAVSPRQIALSDLQKVQVPAHSFAIITVLHT
jgi:alpha-L-arabinofuranosidase